MTQEPKTLQHMQEEVRAKFDAEFGHAPVQYDGPSSGRRAGCDDCNDNQDLRRDHRAFVETLTAEVDANAEARGFAAGQEVAIHESGSHQKVRDAGYAAGYAAALDAIEKAVPEEKERDVRGTMESIGFNACRSKILSAITALRSSIQSSS